MKNLNVLKITSIITFIYFISISCFAEINDKRPPVLTSTNNVLPIGIDETENIGTSMSVNANNEKISIDFNKPLAGKTAVNVFDLLGKTIISDFTDDFNYSNQKSYHLNYIPKNIYILQLVNNEDKYIQKFFVQ